MLRLLNRKSNFKINIHKRKYHVYLEKSKLYDKYTYQISFEIICDFEYGKDIDDYLFNNLGYCTSICSKCEKIYNLLKKLDENQEIFKSDYNSEIIEAIEIDKHSNIANPIVTTEIYAKFDKFKQSIE